MLVLRKECLESGSALSQFVWELCENFINVYHAALPATSTPLFFMLLPSLLLCLLQACMPRWSSLTESLLFLLFRSVLQSLQ